MALRSPMKRKGKLSLSFGAFIGEGRLHEEMIGPMISKD
jgi:hypothetical protein